MMKTASLAVALILIHGALAMLNAQDLRPTRDDVGFCWDAGMMDKLVGFLEKGEKNPPQITGLVGGISPHDDFLYAGRVYIPLYRALRAKEVVVFGVTHGTVRKEIGDPKGVVILDSYTAWRGPYGPVAISPLREYVKGRLGSSDMLVSNKAHELEHSIEATVPFLQHYNLDVAITPIMVTAMPLERMDAVADTLSRIIAAYIRERHLTIGKDIAFLISSDANHYGKDFNNIPFGEDAAAHRKGVETDSTIASRWLAGTLDDRRVRGLTAALWGATYADQGHVVWCGKYSIPFGLLTMKKTMELLGKPNVEGTVLRCSDSYTEGVLPLTQTGMGLTAPFSLKHWCGYVAAGYRTY